MSKKLAMVLLIAGAALPLAVQALGLGEIKLNSALNQPLSADIPVVGATPEEIDSLQVKLASAQQFEQAGIPLPQDLAALQFKVVKNPDGSVLLHIATAQPVKEPFLDFLLDARWDKGELLREYTVFLNPPNFEPAAAPAVAPPAEQPAQAAQPAAPAVAPPPAPVPVAVQPPAPPAPAPVAAPVASTPLAAPAAPPPPSLPRNYGPIRRGETLSEIALRLRPQGVTLNQMMIAIYRANPEVFMHNINLMKAGYVLRLPSNADVRSVTVTEANAEVRAQVAAWRESRGMQLAKRSAAGKKPALQLVAPGSAVQAGENPLPGAGEGGKAGTGTAAGPVPGGGENVKAPPGNAPVTVESPGMAAVQNQAVETNKPAAPAPKPAPPKPKPVARPPAPAPTASFLGTLTDTLVNPYVIAAVLFVLVVALIGVAVKKRRGGAAVTAAKTRPVKTKKESARESTDWQKKEEAGFGDTLSGAAAPPAAAEVQPAAENLERSTVSLSKPAEAAGDKSAVKLDESDPVAEADFHMAYGLYDQAAEVLNKALRQEPGRRELKLKLLEVYFTAGQRERFVQAARELHQESSGKSDKDWESVVIMGRQLAPEEPLFSTTGTASASGVDIALESGAAAGTHAAATDFDPLAGAFDKLGGPGSVPPPAPAAAGEGLDFALPDIEPTPAAAQPPAAKLAAAKPESGLDFELSGLDIEPAGAAAKAGNKPLKEEPTVTADFGTDSQVEFDKALRELADFVNTNVPPQEEPSRPATGLSLDAEPPAGAGPASRDEASGVDAVATKLDLARAYIDMGDSEGAKNILEEVLQEGDARQKQQAQELMKQLA